MVARGHPIYTMSSNIDTKSPTPEEPVNDLPPNPIIPPINLAFQDNVYQLLEDTYQRLPSCPWICPFRRSQLIENRINISQQLVSAKTNLNAIATTLIQSLSKLIKIKTQKVVFDFMSNSLDAL